MVNYYGKVSMKAAYAQNPSIRLQIALNDLLQTISCNSWICDVGENRLSVIWSTELVGVVLFVRGSQSLGTAGTRDTEYRDQPNEERCMSEEFTEQNETCYSQ